MGLEKNPAIRFVLQRAGRVYTAGPAAENAVAVCESLAAQGFASIASFWTGYLDDPDLVCDSYIYLLDLIQRMKLDCYLSVKATALGFKSELVEKILHEAAAANTTIHFDSMAPDTVDRTFALIEQARRTYSNLGYTLPARWRRSRSDTDRIIDLGLRVRIVKGQWSGLNGDDGDPQDGFVRLVDRLISKGGRHVAVATHNPAVAHATLSLLKNSGKSHELELLHKLPRHRMLKIAREYEARTRVYVPCGEAGMPYRLKEIARHPLILVWFTRDLIRSSWLSPTGS